MYPRAINARGVVEAIRAALASYLHPCNDPPFPNPYLYFHQQQHQAAAAAAAADAQHFAEMRNAAANAKMHAEIQAIAARQAVHAHAAGALSRRQHRATDTALGPFPSLASPDAWAERHS